MTNIMQNGCRIILRESVDSKRHYSRKFIVSHSLNLTGMVTGILLTIMARYSDLLIKKMQLNLKNG
jgi:hypothetical protein